MFLAGTPAAIGLGMGRVWIWASETADKQHKAAINKMRIVQR
jgi:hypothetical protein